MEKRQTKQDFIAAFWQLYEQKPIEKISINQLCQLAGYNRATFYNHFDNIYALLDDAVDALLTPVKKKIFSLQGFHHLLQGDAIETVFFTYFQEQNRTIELLFRRQNDYVLRKQVKKAFLQFLSDNHSPSRETYEKIELLLDYHLSGVLGVIHGWYQNGKQLPEQAVIQKIVEISTQGVLNVLKTDILPSASAPNL